MGQGVDGKAVGGFRRAVTASAKLALDLPEIGNDGRLDSLDGRSDSLMVCKLLMEREIRTAKEARRKVLEV